MSTPQLDKTNEKLRDAQDALDRCLENDRRKARVDVQNFTLKM